MLFAVYKPNGVEQARFHLLVSLGFESVETTLKVLKCFLVISNKSIIITKEEVGIGLLNSRWGPLWEDCFEVLSGLFKDLLVFGNFPDFSVLWLNAGGSPDNVLKTLGWEGIKWKVSEFGKAMTLKFGHKGGGAWKVEGLAELKGWLESFICKHWWWFGWD